MNNMLHDIFIQEAEENLQILESRIINIEENPDDKSMINEAFRAIHSIKGGAGLAGFPVIKDFTHIVEDLFEHIRSGTIVVGEELISVILEAMDLLKLMVDNIKNNAPADQGITTEASVAKINKFLNNPDVTDTHPHPQNDLHESSLYYIDLTYYSGIFNTGIDPLMFFGDLERSGEILFLHTETSEFPVASRFNPEKLYLSWKLFYETSLSRKELLDIFCFVTDESRIIIEKLNLKDTKSLENFRIQDKTIFDCIHPSRTGEGTVSQETTQGEIKQSSDRKIRENLPDSYIRVTTLKLEKIFNTVSELLISQARLNMLTEEFEDAIPDSFATVTDSLKNITQRLQEQVTSLRMMNLSTTFDRFKRVVRDIASDRGKKIRLVTEGQDTELDKNMIEKLNDPLKHLVRNSIDHGIETEEERVALGKPPESLLKLSAYLESGKVVIEVSDDGRGIDREKIRKKAEAQGIISSETRLSDAEILNLIFHPGLSTAEKVTDLSGRGVGMDVVKNCINDLHGNIDIVSRQGKGTTFKLYLPLTLAILDGMLVSVGKEKFIIPTLTILEIFRPESFQLKSISGEGEVVSFRGEYIPLIRLHAVFDVKNHVESPVQGEVIVIHSGGMKAAILVDSVLEQYQIVLKSLQKNFRKVEHISSATILGNGDVSLIVDIPSLVQNSKTTQNV